VEHLDGQALALEILSLVRDAPRRARMGASARASLRGDALEVIATVALSGTAPVGAEQPTAPSDELPSNSALLARLERAAARPGYRVEDAVSESDRRYFVALAASLLARDEWPLRNVGVKLLGLLGARDHARLLTALLSDRRPAPRIQRLLGGDFEQVGFVRRNAITALGRLNAGGREVDAVLIAALADPYYETRSEALRVIARRERKWERRGEAALRIRPMLADRNVEVAAAAAETLGCVGDGVEDAVQLLQRHDDPRWPVRAAALRGLASMLERDDLSREALSLIVERAPAFLLTSTGFTPTFEIKVVYARLLEGIRSSERTG
jgi:UDP-N-acetylglucosamine--N-acetylmuramyl-(pentapeptide) pyrophosphoryl-undecaprenol N-acetylglucosamine transferase